ncbi:MAG: metallophosphatase family protein [Acidimicrobiales bacterium]|nr:metallophosphatase family protein [Acidimicrobiales bacterium]
MRIGIVSDLHSNAVGLAAALDRMGDVDELLCAGDMVEDYRFSNEVVELLREREARCVLGNHDLGLLAPHGARAREAAHVRAANVEWLAGHPLRLELQLDGLRVLMTHASPCDPCTQYVFPRSKELERLAEVDADVVVLGHTHSQMAVRVGRALVVNPGSAGDARDPGNGRRFSYAVLDTGTLEVAFDDFDPVR